VTVHASEYYKNKGKTDLHPDMESPNPNHQLAVQGSFYFVIEGLPSWAELGMKILSKALQEEGVGGKVAAGYGYFKHDPSAQNQSEKMIKTYHTQINQRHEVRQQQQQDASEQNKVAQMSEAQQIIYALEQHYTDYEAIAAPTAQDKGALNQQVNSVLDQGKEWTAAERQEAAQMIEKCYHKTINSKKRPKKLQKLQHFIDGVSP
jgi:CRISPR-associated protein Cmr6